MILTEQKIKRIGRRFWRGSKYKTWQKSKSPYNCLYVTGDLFYAITYLKSEEFDFRENGYLIEYVLKDRVNIFNARYYKDYRKLEDWCRVHNSEFLKVLPKLKDYDWLDVLSSSNRNRLIDILKGLGYDGFFNIENKQGKILRRIETIRNEDDLYGFSGLGIFDEKCLSRFEEYQGWKEITKLPEVKRLIGAAKEECKSIILRMYKSALEKFEITSNILELLKTKLIKYLEGCSFLPFFLMTDAEISKFVQNFNFEKELLEEEIYKKKRIHKPIFNRC